MLQFNTAFLLKATAITALCCLPMAYNEQSGFVWTAFLLPISLAGLAATQVGRSGSFEFRFEELSQSVVEVHTTNGRYDQWFTRGRIIVAGGCLSVSVGPPMLHLVDPGPIGLWLPLVLLFAVGAVMLVGYSERRRVLTEERQFVTDYWLFGRLCWLRRRWRVREGDYVAVFLSGVGDERVVIPEFRFFHMLFVCRAQRRYMFAHMFTTDKVVPDMEIAARRVAKLVNVPYAGYQKEKVDWYNAELPNIE